MNVLLWCTVFGCLAFASVTDVKSHQVYNVTWWFGAFAGMMLSFFDEMVPMPGQLLELAVFFALQLLVFNRMYGKADGYAFCICALAGVSKGFGMMEFLIHMAVAFTGLGIVQGMKHNVKKDGNLKKPVPFLPYITLAFCVMLWYHYIC